MRQNIIRLLFPFLVLVLYCSATTTKTATNSQEAVFKLLLTKPLNITKKDNVVLARMSQESLTKEAKEAGISNIVFEGIPQYTEDNDKSRVDIVWTTIRTVDSQKKETILATVTSKFRTKSFLLPASTSFNAKGDIVELSENMRKLLTEESNEKTTNNKSNNSNNTTNSSGDDKDSVASTYFGSSSGNSSYDSSSDSSGSNSSGDSTSDGSNLAEVENLEDLETGQTATQTTTKTEDCPLRIAYDEGKAYKQTKTITTDVMTGEESAETCQDTGETVPFTQEMDKTCGLSYDHSIKKAYKQYKEYVEYNGEKTEVKGCTPNKETAIDYTKVYEPEDCKVIVDFGAKKAFIQYKEYVKDDWTGDEIKQVEVTDCNNDREKFYELFATNDTCNPRIDFEKEIVNIQEKWQYTDSAGETHDATNCMDSTTSYSIFLTDKTCTPEQIDQQIFIYKRKAYTDKNNIIHYVSDCEPISTAGITVQKEVCEDKYEHDLANNQSYIRIKNYYIDDQRIKHYLTDCYKDTTQSFPHTWDTQDCPHENNDNTLSYKIQAKRVIVDNGVTVIVTNVCETTGNSIPYTLIGNDYKTLEYTSNATWTVPKGAKQATVLLVAGGYPGTNTYNTQQPYTVPGTYRGYNISCQPYNPNAYDRFGYGCSKDRYGAPRPSYSEGSQPMVRNALNGWVASHGYSNYYCCQKSGDVYYPDTTAYKTICNNGSAGQGGAVYQGSVSVLSGQNINITIGGQGKSSYFGSCASAVGTGSGYGSYGKGGSAGVCGGSTSGGAGTGGYLKLTYNIPKYNRGDGTIYQP